MEGTAMVDQRTQERTEVGAHVVRGAIGGLIAGAAFAVLNMWFAASTASPAKMPLLVISTIVKGSGAVADGTASVTIGMIVHVVLSVAFGVVFGLFAARLSTNGAVALAGTVYGGLLFVVNFLVLAPLVFHAFEKPNKPFELAVHVVYGTLLSFFLYNAGVRRGEPALGGAGRH